jgi:hypothetical protein
MSVLSILAPRELTDGQGDSHLQHHRGRGMPLATCATPANGIGRGRSGRCWMQCSSTPGNVADPAQV